MASVCYGLELNEIMVRAGHKHRKIEKLNRTEPNYFVRHFRRSHFPKVKSDHSQFPCLQQQRPFPLLSSGDRRRPATTRSNHQSTSRQPSTAATSVDQQAAATSRHVVSRPFQFSHSQMPTTDLFPLPATTIRAHSRHSRHDSLHTQGSKPGHLVKGEIVLLLHHNHVGSKPQIRELKTQLHMLQRDNTSIESYVQRAKGIADKLAAL
ncbi:hypothetical protein H5410_008697 [Solanum commersonii]|uniref:Uncharacterized protein n=1 Tax=Solanum commersonii TaxID=4109 RepID=A0A9J6AHI0_SOLCO|nr:hypothetical protein H5410_008697 [Solanum commersonii]